MTGALFDRFSTVKIVKNFYLMCSSSIKINFKVKMAEFIDVLNFYLN